MGVGAGADSGEAVAEAGVRPLQAIVALGGIQVFTMLAGLARTKVLAVLLGPSGVGIAGVIDQTVALITHLGSLSLPFAALRYLSRRRSEGPEAFSRLYWALLKTLVAASVLATAIAVGIAIWRTPVLGAELQPYRWALVLGLAGAPGLTVVALLRNVLAAIDRPREAALAALLGGLALIGTSYAGVRLGGLGGLYAGNLVVAALSAIALLWYLFRVYALSFAAGRGSVLPVLRAEPRLLEFCTIVHLLSIASPLAYLVARVDLLSHHGAEVAGLFSAAYGLALAVRVVLNQGNALYLSPLVNEATPPDRRAAAMVAYLRVLTVIVVLSGSAIVLFPSLWLRALYSARFIPAGTFLAAFMLSESILLVAGVYQALLVGFDDVRTHLAISVLGQSGIVAVALWLVPSHGALGVAAAFIVGHSVILALTVARLVYAHGARSAGRPVGPLAVGLVIVGLLGWWAAGAHAPPLFWKLALYTALAAVAVRLLTAEERRWILGPWRGAGARATGDVSR